MSAPPPSVTPGGKDAAVEDAQWKVAVVASKGSPTLFSNASDSRGSELWEEAMESDGG